MTSEKRRARTAGLLYLIVAVCGGFSERAAQAMLLFNAVSVARVPGRRDLLRAVAAAPRLPALPVGLHAQGARGLNVQPRAHPVLASA